MLKCQSATKDTTLGNNSVRKLIVFPMNSIMYFDYSERENVTKLSH